MSRRTEPAPLPPRYRAERAPDGAWRVGPSPSMPCSSCSGWFDPGLYAACPFCDTLADETEQQHMADLAQWALEVATVNDSIH